MQRTFLGLCCAIALLVQAHVAGAQSNPVLFVTQVPVGGFTVLTSTFGNHQANPDVAPRGGDLVIRYPDGSLRFLTQEAGYGSSGLQGANAIAVREPCVHWNGDKALFSMIVGAPTAQYQVNTYRWQIYEVSGLAQGATAVIRKIANQPAYNNVSPIYATDGRIIFTSDRPRGGESHLYPQKDEYESAPTVAGIFSLDEGSGDLVLLEHAPSGAFSLSMDSFGRVIFTKWDHLQRDQQGDAPSTAANYKAFTWASEAANAATTTSLVGAEVFPEPRTSGDPAYSPTLSQHHFNHFFPWELNQDGTAEETLNHVGRHELGGSYTDGSIVGDDNLTYYTNPNIHANQLRIGGDGGLLQLREDPTHPGDFFATDAPEFSTGAAGTLMRLTGAPTVNAESMTLTAITPTSGVPAQTGYFRNPLPMSDGTLVAVHTAATGSLDNNGSTASPNWSYQFRLKILTQQGQYYAPSSNLTAGIAKNLSWYTPDTLASYNGTLWELEPVEVMQRALPTARVSTLPAVEAAVFAEQGVDVGSFRAYLQQHELALIVSRNVTQRDRADRQQPFNLQVPGGVASIGAPGDSYDVSFMQIFQGDQVRGYGDVPAQSRGRRVLARPMHGTGVSQAPGGPQSAVAIGLDGSMAALVPARRALTWQLTDPNGVGVVRERNWLSFQSGEIRVCAACHGVNTQSQTGAGEPMNEPEALRDLLAEWKQSNGNGPGGASPTATPLPNATRTATPGGGGNGTPGPTPKPTPASGVCTSGLFAEKTRLKSAASSSSITISGTATIPLPWAGIDPPTNGLRVTVDGVLDVTIPGGAGWTPNKKGTRWRFDDPTGAHGGVRRIDVANRSTGRAPGRLRFSVKVAGASAMPIVGPLDLAVRFGTTAECATAHWNGPTGTKPRCRGSATRMSCS